jgi:hypothetical protein
VKEEIEKFYNPCITTDNADEDDLLVIVDSKVPWALLVTINIIR